MQASNTSICGCRDGYHGDGCQYTGCESNPCLNKGKCVSQKNFDFKCDCPPGFKGKICDQSCPKGNSFVICTLIAWLISTQYKIPVTAGPINPKLPALVSARFKMQNKPYFLFRIFECFVLINKSFYWLINIISYNQKSFDLNQGQKKNQNNIFKTQKRKMEKIQAAE